MKSKFIKSTIILIIGGFIAKLLGMLTKIAISRNIGVDGMGLYMLIMPTFLLFITLSQLGFPIAISKIIAENKNNNKSVILSTSVIALIISIILIIFLILIAPLIVKMLHNKDTYYPLLSIGITLPFISISSIIRGYFFGKEKMMPHTISHIFEQIVRLIMILTISPLMVKVGIKFAVCTIVLFNVVSETASILILYFFLPKKIAINKKDFIPNKEILYDVLNISLPTTGSRLIGSIGYFLEPIILTFLLLKTGYSNEYIVREYGIITGFVMPLLQIPSFFTQAISSALLPVITRAYAKKEYKYIKSKLKQAITISLLIGVTVTSLLIIYPQIIMQFIYNTNVGKNYIRIMAPFFLILYIQTPIITSLQAMNKAKDAMINTLIGTILKTILLIILSIINIGIYSLIISIVFNILFVTLYDYKKLKRAIAL